MPLSAVPRLTELLSSGQLALIAAEARRRKYRDGEIIHERGDAETVMGVVVDGKIKLTTPRRDGTEVFSGLIHTMQNYGDAGMLHSDGRLHRATALGETVVDHLDRPAFDRLTAEPGILRAFYCISTFRLAVTLELLDDMRTVTPNVRLARLVQRMHEAMGGADRLQFLQEDFAGMIGISTVTLAKALRQLEQDGVLECGYRQIRLNDPERLRQWLVMHEQ